MPYLLFFALIQQATMRNLLLLLLIALSTAGYTQTGVIKGKITNSINKEPIPYAVILVDESTLGTTLMKTEIIPYPDWIRVCII